MWSPSSALPHSASGPAGITTGPDGNLWFTESTGNAIGRIATDGTGVTEFALPTPARTPLGITTGPDGNLWFTESTGNAIGRITTAGTVTEFPLPNVGSAPTGITVGPDDNLWFTELLGNRIGRITTAGTISELTLSNANSGPDQLTVGSDSRIWFTERTGDRIGRVGADLTGLTEFALPAGSAPAGITTGCDGNLWFTAASANAVDRLATDGANLTAFPLPHGQSGPAAITSGMDHNLWFTEATGNRVARVGAGCDYAPPALVLPGDVHAVATGPAGAAVTYTVGATDDSGVIDSLSCTPPSGSTFAVGATTVNCEAYDGAGNRTIGSFSVIVTAPTSGAPSQLDALVTKVQGFRLPALATRDARAHAAVDEGCGRSGSDRCGLFPDRRVRGAHACARAVPPGPAGEGERAHRRRAPGEGDARMRRWWCRSTDLTERGLQLHDGVDGSGIDVVVEGEVVARPVAEVDRGRGAGRGDPRPPLRPSAPGRASPRSAPGSRPRAARDAGARGRGAARPTRTPDG